MLHEEIKGEIKKAMLAKNEVRLMVMRGLVAAFTNELVATKRMPQDILPDDDALAVIRRQVKQRKDSIEQFEKGGREDLANDEKAELAILETYLPQMMSKEEIKKIVEAKIAELGSSDLPASQAGKAKSGMLVGALMKELKGKADGADVKAVVDELLQ